MPITIRPATEADLAGIVDLSTLTFLSSNDAILAHLFPPELQNIEGASDAALRELRITRKVSRFSAKRTVIMVAVDDELEPGNLVGYAIWERPAEDGEEDEIRRPPPPSYPGKDKAAFMELIKILEQDEQDSLGDRGTKDVWHLDSLGVHPNQQRRGIGKMLLSWGVEEAKKDGRNCYLVATPAGVNLYRACGFEDVKVVDIFGCPHVSMRKRP